MLEGDKQKINGDTSSIEYYLLCSVPVTFQRLMNFIL